MYLLKILRSILRAVNGMHFERGEIFASFLIMIVFFILSTIFTNLVVMDYEMSILWYFIILLHYSFPVPQSLTLLYLLSSAIIAVSSMISYRSCLRIYNRSKLAGETFDGNGNLTSRNFDFYESSNVNGRDDSTDSPLHT